MVDELVRFAAVRNGPHGELMDSDTFGPDGVEHGIAQPTVRIMIFDRQQSSMRRRCAFEQCRAVDRDDAVQIDDADRDAGRLEFVVGFERFEKRHAGGNDRERVVLALAQHH